MRAKNRAPVPVSTYLTTVVLHKLKWVSRFEKSVERNVHFGPNAANGLHLESWGLIPGPHRQNATLTILLKWPKLD